MSMDAQKLRCLTVAFVLLPLTCVAEASSYQTVNFSVSAQDAAVAEQIGKAAEVYRRQLAVFWLGKPLPNWSRPCKVTVKEGSLGAGGQTTFQFARGEVLNWRMELQGTLERILDSVLPHEVNHTIFACHFRRPLPRWADEGAATLFEHRSEQLKQLALLNEVIRNRNEIISLRDLLAMKEYPRGQRPMLTLYAQGYALADFLVQQKGRHAYLRFIADGERGGWEQAIRNNFDHAGIESLERNWRGWVLAGMPKLTLPRDQMLAANEGPSGAKPQAMARPELPVSPGSDSGPNRRPRPPGNSVIRSQSPDPERPQSTESTGPAARNQVEAAAETPPTNTVIPGSREISPSSHRQSSFEAPVPRRRDSVTTDPIRHGSAGESSGSESSGKPVRTTPASLTEAFPIPGRRAQPVGLEPTGLTTSDGNADSESSGRPDAESFEFSGVVLPGERNVRSGRTPQWAGFPGQKKLF
jgi:hypothetical protein